MIKKIILLAFLLTCSHPTFNMNDVINLSPVKTSEEMASGLTTSYQDELSESSEKITPATKKNY